VFIAKISALPGVAYSRNGADLRIFGSACRQSAGQTYGLKTHTFASFTRPVDMLMYRIFWWSLTASMGGTDILQRQYLFDELEVNFVYAYF
jgi:hypothetical protein